MGGDFNATYDMTQRQVNQELRKHQAILNDLKELNMNPSPEGGEQEIAQVKEEQTESASAPYMTSIYKH